jgi:FixJ family two-component response regulator
LVTELAEAGADGFLEKPFSIYKLSDALNRKLAVRAEPAD